MHYTQEIAEEIHVCLAVFTFIKDMDIQTEL
jgi:hypothetical protein